MKNYLLPKNFRLMSAAVVLLLAAFTAFGQESTPWSQNTSPLPAPTGFVNDYANVIDAATKQRIESSLKALKETSNPSVEIAVAVVRTTGERPIFDYSLAVARGWKIGSKADDNPSALLFIAIDDRKYFTQVSKDLEDELPDGLVGSLQRQYLVPEFKKANYGKGVEDTINAYISTIENKGTPATAKPTPPSAGSNNAEFGGGLFGLFCCGIVLLIILLLIFGRSGKGGGKTKSDGDRWGGGGFGGGGGSSGGDILPAIIGGIIGAALSGGSSSSSSSSDWGSSGGSDWGGFGGGGDFGGGGAGGDW
ncbi:MAG: TPM domain-containing protein [Pyrinomonadaceae bacterium]